ncbi:HNH endonuclease [Solibacillus silvestris]
MKIPKAIDKIVDSNVGEVVKKSDVDEVVGKGADKGKGVSETNLRNIDDFINGNKKFDEIIEDYAKVYKEHVDLNKPWSWDDTIPGGDSLSSAQKRKIKEMAIAKAHIPEIKITKADGMRYGFADFASAGVVEETVQLPDRFWKLSDKEQFKWLDEQIGGTRKGMTWHHTEVPGKMELVPFGIHNITPHNGGRTKGMWADAPR